MILCEEAEYEKQLLEEGEEEVERYEAVAKLLPKDVAKWGEAYIYAGIATGKPAGEVAEEVMAQWRNRE